LDSTGIDGVVFHDRTGGYYGLYALTATTPYLILSTTVNRGALFTGSGCTVLFAKLHDITNPRDDAMVYCNNDNMWRRADASFDGTQTYTSTYIQSALLLNEDQDGDCILTNYELGGSSPPDSTNAVYAFDNILLKSGASPFRKEVFVRVDYMDGPASSPHYTYAMQQEAKDTVVQSMGDHGIKLHIIDGVMVDYKPCIGNSMHSAWSPEEFTYYNDPVAQNQKPFFHYCLFANQYFDGTTNASTGNSRRTPDTMFMVTLGGDAHNDPNFANWQAGTFYTSLDITWG
jgi:hypothetical protein